MASILPLTNGEFRGKKDARIVRAAARLVVLRKNYGRSECLFVRHPTKGLEFPGGAIEPNESPASAALRELQEESGMILASNTIQMKPLGFKNVIDARGGYWLDIVLCTLLDRGAQMRKTTEAEFETKWLSLEQVLIQCSRDDVGLVARAIAELSA